MSVVGWITACIKVRAVLTIAGVVTAAGVLAPVSAAPDEQTGYRRLAELESTRTFSDELTAALASSDARLAGRAALALGRTGDPRAAGLLKNATAAQDVPLRALAVYGYGLLAAKTPLETKLVADRLADAAPAVRVTAIDAAWRSKAAKNPGAATFRAGLTDRDELVRIQFADLVGRRKALAGLSQLKSLLSDPSWRVREQAYESIKVLAGLQRTDHLGAIPAEIATPAPEPENTEAPLPRPTGLGPARKPVAADARLDLALLPATSAQLDGPAAGAHPRVRIGTTKGTLVLRLYPEWAPLTVANFLNLVDRGYYDNLRWFRIVPDFVVQTGDPNDNGEGDAGYTIPAEENPLEQRAGVISMGLNYTDPPDAHAIRDSAGTQFYITLSPQLHLNRDFTVFGEVESGFATLGRLVESDRMTKVVRLADR